MPRFIGAAGQRLGSGATMPALAPLLCLLFLWALLVRHGLGVRRGLLWAAAGCGVWLVAATELLSLAHALTPLMLAIAWVAPAAALAVLHVRLAPRGGPAGWRRPAVRPEPAVFAAVVALIAMVVAVIALAAPPNNYDSLSYHMARVAHWAQAGSVAHYPTHIPRQLWLNPGAEFAVLHLQVLSGGDRFANLVQWSAMVGAAVGVGLIVHQLGGSPQAQALAVLLCATLPMGVLQASSTQNDYVTAFWLVCFVSGVLDLTGGPPAAHGGAAAATGAALGLAMLTKGTAYFVALPFVVWLIAWGVRRLRSGAAPAGLIVAGLALALNAGYWSRNVALYSRPFGPAGQVFLSGSFAPRAVVSNTVKHASLQIFSSWREWNAVVEGRVTAIHRTLGVNPSDPRMNHEGMGFIYVGLPTNHEDVAGNPLHFLMALAAAGVVLASPDLRRQRRLLSVTLALIAGAALFAALMRWQPWASRLQLPWIVLAAAPTAVAVQRFGRPGTYATALLAVAMSIPCLLWNKTRPLVGPRGATVLTAPRPLQYLWSLGAGQDQRHELRALREVMLARPERMGLIIGSNGPDYWYFAMLQLEGGLPIEIQHINVKNESAVLAVRPPFSSFNPDFVMYVNGPPPDATSSPSAPIAPGPAPR